MSGTTSDRPQYQLMLSEVGTIRPAAVILWKIDRLGRDRFELADAKRRIRDAGCRICLIAEPTPDDSPESVLMETMMEGMAEFYSRQLSVNIRRGMACNAEHALYNGHKVWGYGVDGDKHYVVDDAVAPFVVAMFTRYADGEAMQSICDDFNAKGLLDDSENLASIAVDAAKYYEDNYKSIEYLSSLEQQRRDVGKGLDNVVKAIEAGIFNETTQRRMAELQERKDALNDAIEAETVSQSLFEDEHSIRAYFDRFLHADFDNPEVRDSVLEYFVDKIYLHEDRLVVTSWYSEDNREVPMEVLNGEVEDLFAEGEAVKLDCFPFGSTHLKPRVSVELRRARGPAHSHVGPLIRAWATPPTHHIAGLRAISRVSARNREFACELHARPGAVVSTTQTVSAATPIVNVCRRGDPRCRSHTTPNRDLTATKQGELQH